MSMETAKPVKVHAHAALPGPSLWPAFLSLGSMLLLWGMISSLALTLFGAATFLFSLGAWIGEMRHERSKR